MSIFIAHGKIYAKQTRRDDRAGHEARANYPSDYCMSSRAFSKRECITGLITVFSP
jgi:hypothetical protein